MYWCVGAIETRSYKESRTRMGWRHTTSDVARRCYDVGHTPCATQLISSRRQTDRQRRTELGLGAEHSRDIDLLWDWWQRRSVTELRRLWRDRCCCWCCEQTTSSHVVAYSAEINHTLLVLISEVFRCPLITKSLKLAVLAIITVVTLVWFCFWPVMTHNQWTCSVLSDWLTTSACTSDILPRFNSHCLPLAPVPSILLTISSLNVVTQICELSTRNCSVWSEWN